MRTCVKCGGDLPTREGPGRPARYCGVGCRRAAEYEKRRAELGVANAEAQVRHWRRGLADGGWFGGQPAHGRKQLRWWESELQRLEARFAELLEAEAAEVASTS